MKALWHLSCYFPAPTSLPERRWSRRSAMNSTEHGVGVKIQFVPVGRERREWMWKARDESNTITISGQRFDSLNDAVRDARVQISGLSDDDEEDGPDVA